LDTSTSLLAGQAPWWEPGTAGGYHAMNYGHLIGELIRRITGQRLGQFFADHIAGPLGADFHIGLPSSEFHRIANLVPPPAAPAPAATADLMQPDVSSVAMKSLANPVMSVETTWTEGWRRAEFGAGNGHGNARSLAHIQSAVACGGEVDGVRLLSPKTIDRIFEVQFNGIDLVIGIPIMWGIGYGLAPEGRICSWGGYGGSCVIIDVDRRMTFAYVMNKMAPGGGTIGAALADKVAEIVKR
jgi:CubicO group peptidase (beta-lactamase class C family)